LPASNRAAAFGVSEALIMEAPPEISDGIAKTLAGNKPVQCDDVAATRTARVAAEVPVNKRDAERRILFIAPLMDRTADLRPFAARFANQ
jgi:hypothetical protein